jgi:hypothetical protein
MAAESRSTEPSIPLIKLSAQYSGENLDKLKSNYKEWCEEITIALSLNSLYKYVISEVSQPLSIATHALVNWNANRCLVFPFLNMMKGPDTNWTSLKIITKKRVPFLKFNYCNRCSLSSAPRTPLFSRLQRKPVHLLSVHLPQRILRQISSVVSHFSILLARTSHMHNLSFLMTSLPPLPIPHTVPKISISSWRMNTPY